MSLKIRIQKYGTELTSMVKVRYAATKRPLPNYRSYVLLTFWSFLVNHKDVFALDMRSKILLRVGAIAFGWDKDGFPYLVLNKASLVTSITNRRFFSEI